MLVQQGHTPAADSEPKPFQFGYPESWSGPPVEVQTWRSPWPAWCTVAPAGSWVISVVQASTVDYGAIAPWEAEKPLLTILIPRKWARFLGGDHCGQNQSPY